MHTKRLKYKKKINFVKKNIYILNTKMIIMTIVRDDC